MHSCCSRTSFTVVGAVLILAIVLAPTRCAAVSVGPVTGCWPCGDNSDPACCAPGQLCPGQVPCCGATSGAWSCNSTCVPKCYSNVCGDGGCPGSNGCGICPPGQGCNYGSCYDCCSANQWPYCGPSNICKNVSCGTCPSGKGCSDGYCEDCCAYQKCGVSTICPGVNCGSCAASEGCVSGQCESCCPATGGCGMSEKCPGVSCGSASCPTGQGCRNNQCQDCCASKDACGTSWCPGGASCGSCGTGNASICTGVTCLCDLTCQCGGVGCAGCPDDAAGCDGCNCLGPRKNVQKLWASNFVQMTEEGWTITCNGAETCGGITPLGPSQGGNFSISYNGDKGYYSMISIIAVYTTPDGKPLPGDNLYLYFGKGCVSGMTYCLKRDQLINADVSNCTFTNYTKCFSQDGTQCFQNQGCTNARVDSYSTLGNGRGVWVKNPKSSPFTVTYWVTDVYDGIYCSTNSNVATLLQQELYVEYSSN